MPALPSPGKVVRVIFQQSDQSDTNILNRTYFSYTGSVSSADLETLGTSLAGAWTTYMKPIQTSRYSLTSINMADLSSDLGAVYDAPESIVGTASGTNQPSSVCLVIKGAISRRYRGGHPRVYLTGFNAANLATADTWSSTFVTTVLDAWGALLGVGISDAPSDLGTVASVNVSYYKGFTSVQNPITLRYRAVPNLRATPVVDVINSWSADVKVGSQRRRNENRG